MDLLKNDNQAARFLTLALASVAAGIGLLAIAGWIFGFPLLASFGANLIPMAPSTALLFVLYGAALFISNRFPSERTSHLMSVIVGSLGLAIALTLFVLSSAGIHPQIEHLGLSPFGTFAGVPVGHMSPLTAFCFVVIAMSMLAARTSSAERLWPARVAFWLACLIFVVSLALLMAYMIGTPILYSSDVIPPALSTSLAFFALALGLIMSADLRLRPDRRERDIASARESYVLVLVFVLLASGIVTAGYYYYKNYERQYRLGVERQLSAIAQLKMDELVRWRNERLADGQVFYMNKVFSGIVKRYFQHRNDPDARMRIRTWVGQVQRAYDYELMMLLDAQLRTRFVVPENKEPARLVIDRKTIEILLSGNIAFQDFYRNDQDDRVYLKVLVPILDDHPPKQLIGVLALRIDPEKHLYPMISRWPVPSRSSETLIIRREGHEALFLNELRFQKNTALNLRVSLSNVRMPAAMAALGQEGIVEGVDYRGVPVVADVRAIPGSPWFLVARMDASEVYAPLRERLWEMVGLIVVLLFGAAAGVGFVWRHQRARFYRQQYKTVEALNASELRYRLLFETAKDGILVLDAETGIVVDVNPFLVGLLGFSQEEFLGKKIWELGFFKDIAESKANFLELQKKEYIRYEDLPLKTAKGKQINVEFVSNVYQVNHQKVVQCNIRDITERKRAEEKLALLVSRQKAILSAVPDIIMEVNNDKMYTWANQAGIDFFGADVVGKGASFYFEGEQETYEIVLPLFKGDENIIYIESWQRRKDGERRLLAWWCRVLKDENGKVIGALSSARDITERKQAEEALKISNERLLFATEGANLGIWNWNIVTGELIWSDQCKALFGVPPDETMSYQRFSDALHPDDRERTDKAVKDTLDNHKDFDIEYRSLWPDESIHWLAAKGRGYYDATGKAVRLEGVVLDITESKRKEKEFESAKSLLDTVIDSSPFAMWICDREGMLIRTNRSLRETLNLTDEQLIGKYNVLNDLNLEMQGVMPMVRAVFEMNTTARFIIPWKASNAGDVDFKGGRDLYIDVSIFPILDNNGKLTNVVCQWVDITERKQAENALATSEVRYRRLFETARDGILILHAYSGMVVDVNPFLVKMLGYSSETFLGKHIWELGFFKDVAANKANFLELQQKEYIKYENLPLETALGELINVEFISHVYEVDHQKVIQCNIRDITERKRAEEALRESQSLYHSFIEQLPNPVFRKNREGRYVLVNSQFCRLKGVKKEDLIGRRPLEVAASEVSTQGVDGQATKYADVGEEVHEQIVQSGKIVETEEEYPTVGGGILHMQVVRMPVFDSQGIIIGTQGIMFDVSERKRAEEENRKLNTELESRVAERTAQLEAANKELEAFSYSVSHDLRAPLRAVDGFSRIVLEEYAQKLDPEASRLLNVICASTQKMDELITDLLDLSRVSRNEMHFSRVAMAMLANSIYHEAASPEVRQKFSFSVAPIPDALCDPVLIRQVWRNLISNAIKFTTPMEVRRIEIGGQCEEGKVVYFIRDSGVGFDPRYTHKLFGVFQRLHKAEEFEGTGVGLAIVQHIIDRHGGKVWAEGKVGEGATFWFSIPHREG